MPGIQILPTPVTTLYSAEPGRLPPGFGAALDLVSLNHVRSASHDEFLQEVELSPAKRCANEGSVSFSAVAGGSGHDDAPLTFNQMAGLFVVCGALALFSVAGAVIERILRRAGDEAIDRAELTMRRRKQLAATTQANARRDKRRASLGFSAPGGLGGGTMADGLDALHQVQLEERKQAEQGRTSRVLGLVRPSSGSSTGSGRLSTRRGSADAWRRSVHGDDDDDGDE